nr:hypothetical protein [Paracoccus onubensis]
MPENMSRQTIEISGPHGDVYAPRREIDDLVARLNLYVDIGMII